MYIVLSINNDERVCYESRESVHCPPAHAMGRKEGETSGPIAYITKRTGGAGRGTDGTEHEDRRGGDVLRGGEEEESHTHACYGWVVTRKETTRDVGGGGRPKKRDRTI